MPKDRATGVDTASTITSGATVRRCGFIGGLLYSVGVTGFIYPIIGHWAWVRTPPGAVCACSQLKLEKWQEPKLSIFGSLARMTRVPELKSRESVTEDQRQAFDDIVASRGSIRGPFGVLLHSPELARRAAAVGGYLRYESSLAPRLRETAVMATAGLNECAYEWAAHEPIARDAGVPAEVIDAIRERRPADLDPEDRDIYDLASGIIQAHHVPTELFERLKTRLGLTGLVETVAAIGYWSFVAATLNTFDVRLADH